MLVAPGVSPGDRIKKRSEVWSAVASVARHRFGFADHYLSRFNQSAVAASLCRRTPNSLSISSLSLGALYRRFSFGLIRAHPR